jgi:transcriptional regulator with XRE-family HTH domain
MAPGADSRPYKAVGHRIADLRRAKGRLEGRRVTQREVAEAVGVSPGTVTAWEIGKQRPEGRNLERLAAFLGVFPEEITSADVSVTAGPGPALPPTLARLLVREPRPAPNYAGLGIELPGYEKLLEGPRRLFDAFMVDLIRRGLGREELEEVGRGALAPFVSFRSLGGGGREGGATEAAQMRVLAVLLEAALAEVEGA